MMIPASMMVPPNSESNLSDLNNAIEALISELQHIKSSTVNLHDATALEKFEKDIHAKTTKLADLLSAVKLQEALDDSDLDEAEKELIKSHPKKLKNMGNRPVTIRMLGGTPVAVSSPYYHQKTGLKKSTVKRVSIFACNYWAFTTDVPQRLVLR